MGAVSRSRPNIAVTGAASLVLAAMHSGCAAQATTPPAPQAATAGYPATYQPAQPQALQAAPARPSFLRQMFVNTVGAVLEGVSNGLTGGLSSRVNGAIQQWFDKSLGQQGAQAFSPYAQAQTYPTTTFPTDASATYPGTATYPTSGASYPAATSYPPASTDPYGSQGVTYPTSADASAAYPPASATYPSATYPTTDQSAAAAYPSSAAYPASDQYATAASYSPAVSLEPSPTSLYAGFAFEVHALQGSGSSAPIDPASHVFATGDRFVIHYRPTLPGRVAVVNINPLGQRKRIDDVAVAAGQLTTLGPYEFQNVKGDETLRLVLQPCRSEALLLATRDIVNPTVTATSSLNLGECSTLPTRSARLRTRDIGRVQNEDGTNFALDPVSAQEISSGEVASRELDIVLHHR